MWPKYLAWASVHALGQVAPASLTRLRRLGALVFHGRGETVLGGKRREDRTYAGAAAGHYGPKAQLHLPIRAPALLELRLIVVLFGLPASTSI